MKMKQCKLIYRKFVCFGIILFSVFLFSSCEESFDPYAPFKEKLIVNFILRADTSLQIATVSRSHAENNPGGNYAVTDADVKLWIGDKVYTLRDTVIAGKNYTDGTPMHCYYTNSFEPVSNESASLRVESNQGKILTASTQIPYTVTFNYTGGTSLPPKDLNLRDKELFTIAWKHPEEQMWFLPVLSIRYMKPDGTVTSVRVPSDYVQYKGKAIAQYPGVTQQDEVYYKRSAIDSAMAKIAPNAADKKNYTVLSAVFDVMVLDRHLAAYYMSTNSEADSYSIQLDENDYTNINGGFGIFASFCRHTTSLVMDGQYVSKFGYKLK